MTLTLVHLLPELLGTYGDRGNVDIASWRLTQRGIA
ncbi:MAG: glutamine amidotransferase, partial [Actinobacteria bacterium]|nr:glutamine amidotransferase [Actinomycetota bacterium]